MNGGLLDVNSGTVGAVDVATGATLDVDGGTLGAIDNSGTTTIDSASATSLTNTANTSAVNAGGSVTFTTTVTGGTVTVAGGTLTGKATVNGGLLDVNSGTVGAVDVATGATLDVDGGTLGAIDNSGTTTIDSASATSLTNTANTSAVNAGGSVTFTTTVTGGTVTVAGGTLTGAATVGNATSGTAILTQTSGSTGAVTVSDRGTLNASGGTVGAVEAAVDSSGTAADVNLTGTAVVASLDLNAGAGHVVSNNAEVTGVVTIDNATLTQSGAGSKLGTDGTTASTVTVGTTGVLDVNGGMVGAIDNSGTTTIDSASATSLTNTANTSAVNAGGSVTFTTTVTGGTVTVAGGTLTGKATVNGGLLDVNSGTVGAVEVTNGAATIASNLGGTLDVTGGMANVDGTSTITGLITVDGGTITVDSGASLTSTAGVNVGDGTGTDTFAVIGTFAGDVTLDAGGVLAVSNGFTGARLSNTGSVNNTNNGTHTITLSDTYVATGVIETGTGGGVLTINSANTIEVRGNHVVNGTGTLVLNAPLVDYGVNATLAASQASDIKVSGGSTLTVDTGADGTVVVGISPNTVTDVVIDSGSTLVIEDGETLQAGSLRNDGTLTVDAGATFRGTGNTFNNNGPMTVADGGTITDAGAINNNATGTLTFAGNATVDADDDNAGGEIVTNAGTFIVNDTAGSTVAIGNDAFTNSGTGTIAVNGTATLSGITTLTNSSTSVNAINIAAGATLAATNLNSSVGTITIAGALNAITGITGGTVRATGTTASVGGPVSMTAGTLDLQSDGVATTLLTINGDASLNGTVLLDADLSDGSTDADTIAVTGNLSGSVGLSFNNVAATEGSISNVDIFTYTGSNTLSFSSVSGLPANSQFEYFIQDNATGNVQLQSRVNTGIANLAATVGLTQTVVGTIVNRPTSPFVSDFVGDKSEDACGAGGWARVTGGAADAEGSFTDVTSNQSATTPVSLSYGGLQMGGDFACFGGHYNGWDMSFGGIGGFNKGSSSNNVFDVDFNTGLPTSTLLSVTHTDIDQVYGGVYMTAARGRFFSDLQYRYASTEYTSSNTEVVAGRGFDLKNEVYTSKGQTLSGSFGYSWPIGSAEGLNFVSSVGFSFTDLKTDTIDLGTDGSMQINDSKSQIGFVSATVAKSKVLPDDISLLSYFGTVTYYNDFADDPTAVFTSNTGQMRELTLSNIGSYTELSAGLNYVRLLSPGDAGNARQLNAAVRVDARVGEDVESWGIAGQFRLQF